MLSSEQKTTEPEPARGLPVSAGFMPGPTNGNPGLPPQKPSKVQATFAALHHKNYRLWFFGQMFSLIGTWMQSTAQGYFMYELTGSAAYLGLIGFANGIPAWLFMLIGGAVSDRIPRRVLLTITQSVMMILALTLAGLTFSGLVQPWHILVMAFCLGTANAFDAPSRQAFVTEMVDKEDLTNAIALNATMFNTATAVGPSIGGITYALLGPAWCFAVNGLSFIAVIISLQMMKMKPFIPRQRKTSVTRDIREGISYVIHHPNIRILIAGLGVFTLFGMGFVTLFPAWARDIMHGDETTNGFLQSARGAGALIGSLMIASSARNFRRGRTLNIGLFIFAALLLIYAQVRWLPLSLLLLAGIGWGFVVFANMTNSLVQTQVADELRGRVMSIYTLVFFGLMPVASLITGIMAETLGAPVTVMIGAGLLLLLATLALFKFPHIRKLV